ncbi:CPBP family intramembrane metalloprotease [Myxococcota bacterium]|nr:CPBP family intramembrane metalloprotease [Myxococcota bacterium]
MTGQALASLFALAATAALLVLVVGRRLARARGPWDLRDALLALVLLPWTSTAVGGALLVVRTGDLQGAVPTLGETVLASAAGGLCAALFAAVRAGRGGGLRALGLRGARPGAWLLAIALAPAFLGLSAAWNLLLDGLGHRVAPQRILEEVLAAPDSPVAMATVAYGVLLAPVVEELVFRGFLLPPLARRLGPAAAVGITSLLFGLMHLSDPAAVPPLVAFGLALGLLRLRSASLGPPVLLHLLNNAAAFGLALAG